MKLAHDTWVIVADGESFLLLRNRGDEALLDLMVIGHEETETPPARELSTDRPGRRQDATRSLPGGTGPVRAWGRSAMEETDWHRVAKERFAAEIAGHLRAWAADGRFRHLVVVADPRTLGELRSALGHELSGAIVAEIPKDLTNLPLDRIEATLSAHG